MYGLGGILLFIVFFFGGLVSLIVTLDRIACEDMGEVMNVRTEWRATTGCFVQRGDKMLPLDKWMALEGVTE